MKMRGGSVLFYYFLGVRIKSLQNKFSILVGLRLHNVLQLREDKQEIPVTANAMKTSLLP